MLKLSDFIVSKRKLIFLFVIIGLIFSFFSRNWVEVEDTLEQYLSPNSETRMGLDIMEDQFVTLGTADIMVSSISYGDAENLCKRIEKVSGVDRVEFDDSPKHYNNVSAMYNVTFTTSDTDDESVASLDRVKELLSGYDTYVSTSLGNSIGDIIDKEISLIIVYVAVIVGIVLTLTSQTYAEVVVMALTFIIAMVLNMGTNFLLGTISFVSNSVTSILQLALSLDYAVILCNRFKEEREVLPNADAAVVALSKAIPEIGASCLTTVGGLCAMLFMQFKIGPDMAICLIKAIAFALLSVFLFMPGLLVSFGPLMDKTRHKKFIPEIPFVGRFAYKTRKQVPIAFIVLIVAAIIMSGRCPYVYGYDSIETPKLNYVQEADLMIKNNFEQNNMVALVVPAGDYEKESGILARLESMGEVDHTMGLANIEAMDGYMLTDKLNPRQFGELAGLDYEAAQIIYAGFAADNQKYGTIAGGLDSYEVPLIDMLMFACEQVQNGMVNLNEDEAETLSELYDQISTAKMQLQGDEYSRMLVYLNLPESGDETYNFLDTMRSMGQQIYPDGTVLVVGDSTSAYDFQKSFETDNIIVSIISILIVLLVLLFTFKSVAMPILLILVIQGSIWVNFSIPTIASQNVFFMSYLVASAIQMGANIDYAIVIASRYMEIKNRLPRKQAIIETMNFAFPTIITSGTILAVSGILISFLTSDATIVGIGQALARGTIASIILVMFVLPQIMLLGEKIIDMSSFSMGNVIRRVPVSGQMRINGFVSGEIRGTVQGRMNAIVSGDANLNVISGEAQEVKENEENI